MGVQGSGSPVVNAKNNWWGDASGPAPYGTGNAVSSHEETDQWGNKRTVVDVDVFPWVGQPMADGPSLSRTPSGGYAADPVNVATATTHTTSRTSRSLRAACSWK